MDLRSKLVDQHLVALQRFSSCQWTLDKRNLSQQVPVPHGHAAGGDEQVALLQRGLQRRRQALEVVLRHPSVRRLKALRLEQRDQGGLVAVPDVPLLQLLSRFLELITLSSMILLFSMLILHHQCSSTLLMSITNRDRLNGRLTTSAEDGNARCNRNLNLSNSDSGKETDLIEASADEQIRQSAS